MLDTNCLRTFEELVKLSNCWYLLICHSFNFVFGILSLCFWVFNQGACGGYIISGGQHNCYVSMLAMNVLKNVICNCLLTVIIFISCFLNNDMLAWFDLL